MSRIQSEGAWDVNVEDVGHLFVNLAAVDLGLRLFALRWITGVDTDLTGVPLWGEENGIGKILRSRLHETGLTRGQLAGRLGVSETTVDNWLDGRNWPGWEHVDSLAIEFARGDPEVAEPLAAELRRQFALAKLCHGLAMTVGHEHVSVVVEAVAGLARDLFRHVGPRLLSAEERPVIGPALMMMGSEFPMSPAILRFFSGGYPDGMWRDVILAAAAPWELAFGLAMKKDGGSKSSAAGLAQDYLDVVDDSDQAHAVSIREAITRALVPQLDAAIPRSPFPIPEVDPLAIWKEGIAVRRRLVERFPSSPDAHFQLGSLLGKVGQRTGVRKFVDEGLIECRIAFGLCPAWDAPGVELGIILTNFGLHQEALDELEQVAAEFVGAHSALAVLNRVCFNGVGVLCGGSGTPGGGGSGQARLCSGVPVRCPLCFQVWAGGQRAWNYAKAARRLGDPTEFDAWQRGEYRVRRK